MQGTLIILSLAGILILSIGKVHTDSTKILYETDQEKYFLQQKTTLRTEDRQRDSLQPVLVLLAQARVIPEGYSRENVLLLRNYKLANGYLSWIKLKLPIWNEVTDCLLIHDFRKLIRKKVIHSTTSHDFTFRFQQDGLFVFTAYITLTDLVDYEEYYIVDKNTSRLFLSDRFETADSLYASSIFRHKRIWSGLNLETQQPFEKIIHPLQWDVF
ncbi:hypothetical protein QNI19_27375 [Cytophagaceae bacterium DM2B3-1]|uniref:Uncharacterized protein n=1 Tax=Xanthocytophaga flava TaxID=3048013 RepID=A0ABT7CUS4_9BACT|nr:hypothetical protein [Xanthocytophaga flavus]MDJ1471468.1 hypothetical protein [Xanthocytophaga flavus]MDJ1496685.1 hypothetical protein [Xanthocytophaga flavus]